MDKNILRVSSAMKTSLLTISGVASVQEAIDMMRKQKIHSLVIEPRDDNDEYGVVSVFDIAKRVVAINRPTHRTSVYEIMTKPAMTIDQEMNAKYAIRLLSSLKLESALVAQSGKITGFVTLRDLVLAYTEQD